MNQTLVSKNNDCEVKVTLFYGEKFITKCKISFTNNSANTVYVFNRIYSLTKHVFNVDKNNFYTHIRDDNTLVIAKAIIPVPQDMDVEKNIVPYCSKILPQESFEEDIEISLPVKLFDPYEDFKINEEQSYPVIFQFGYFLGHEQTESMEIKIPSTEGEVIYFDPFDYNFQKIIEVGKFSPLPVK